MAEEVGFEPTQPEGWPVFKTGGFSHSPTLLKTKTPAKSPRWGFISCKIYTEQNYAPAPPLQLLEFEFDEE